MKQFPQERDEAARHRKRSKTSKTSRTSKSIQHSNHKHEYEKVILREFIGYAWGGRCKLCGKFQSHYGRFSSARYTDFRRLESTGQCGISNESFLSADEIRTKFPNVPIYEFSCEDMQLLSLD